MVLMAPKDEAELQRMIVTGVNYTDGADRSPLSPRQRLWRSSHG